MSAKATESSTSSVSSFIWGFCLGQILLCTLIVFLIKFCIFGEVPSTSEARSRRNRHRSFSSSRAGVLSLSPEYNQGSQKLSSILRLHPPVTAASLLAKTYYNVKGHQPESVDWFNVLIAQTIAQIRNDAQQDGAILTSLTNLLNGPLKPDFLDDIRVTEINLGDEFPIFSNCRIIPVEENAGRDGVGRTPYFSRPSSSAGPAEHAAGARLQARMDVDLSDNITLGIETKVVLNYPRPFVAVMPIALAITVVRFSGTLSISFIPSPTTSGSVDSLNPTTNTANANAKRSPPTDPSSTAAADPTPPTTLTFSFQPDYRLELSTHSLLGSRSRLQDIPKIAQMLEARLHDWFDQRCVEPRFQQIVLPSLWPRKRNTRGGEVEVPTEDDVSPSEYQDRPSPQPTPSRARAPPGISPLQNQQPAPEAASTALSYTDEAADPFAGGMRQRPTGAGAGSVANADSVSMPPPPSATPLGDARASSYRMPGLMPGSLPA